MGLLDNSGLIARRKVQAGSTSKLVTLPAVWCDAHGIEGGTILEMFSNGEGHLIIRKKEVVMGEPEEERNNG